MALWLIIAITVLLYARTLDYNYVIDDIVKRNGYMYEVPDTAPPPGFWETRPSRLYRIFMIGMHCVNVSVIYMLWGWGPALLFAVHPIGVWGTAWVTGNYYATTAYFCLIAYFFLQTLPGFWGALLAMPLFIASLNSTVCSINFPFLFLFVGSPWGLAMFLPLARYLMGDRFKTGIGIRKTFIQNKPVKAKITIRRLSLMTKVMAKYIMTALFPNNLGFFTGYGRGIRDKQELYDEWHSFNKDFWVSLAICVAVFTVGLFISPVGTFWFFVLMSLHTQWNLMGQFYAQRYLYLPLVGLCVVAGTFLQAHPVLMAIVATILVVRTHFFIPAWQNMLTVWKGDLENFPGNGEAYNNLAQHYMYHPDFSKRGDIVNYTAWLMTRAMMMKPDDWAVHMNQACFLTMVGRLDMALFHTKKSLELIRPLGGLAKPVQLLEEQVVRLEEEIEKQKGLAFLSRPAENKEEGKWSEHKESISAKQSVAAL
jgi:hypothetical protein